MRKINLWMSAAILHIKFDCKGALLPMLVTSKNFYAVRDRAIMLDDAYQEDPYIDDYDDYDY